MDPIELKVKRIRAHIVQYKLAQALGVPQSTFCEYENGDARMPLGLAERIERAIDEWPREDGNHVHPNR